jgi:hypothetical protein
MHMGQPSSTGGETENAVQKIEELKQKNKGLEEQLRGAVARCEVGSRNMVQKQLESAECLVLGDYYTERGI